VDLKHILEQESNERRERLLRFLNAIDTSEIVQKAKEIAQEGRQGTGFSEPTLTAAVILWAALDVADVREADLRYTMIRQWSLALMGYFTHKIIETIEGDSHGRN